MTTASEVILRREIQITEAKDEVQKRVEYIAKRQNRRQSWDGTEPRIEYQVDVGVG